MDLIRNPNSILDDLTTSKKQKYRYISFLIVLPELVKAKTILVLITWVQIKISFNAVAILDKIGISELIKQCFVVELLKPLCLGIHFHLDF